MSEQHPDLPDEQAHIDHAYDCLERSRKEAWKLRDLSEPGRGGTLQARYERDVFDEALIKHHKIMDATAFALCRDQKLPITVFSIFKPGAMKRVVMGEDEGTLVHD